MKICQLIFLTAFSVLALFSLTTLRTSAAPQATFVVTNANNTGVGSLRKAMIDANIAAGGTITFNISGSGVHTIQPITPLPTILKPVTIDGYTQPGTSPNTLGLGDNAVLRIELDGATCSQCDGLEIKGGNSTVRGLVINRFSAGIELTSDANIIEGNFIGTNTTGTVAEGNHGPGVSIFPGSSNSIGGTIPGARNLLSGNLYGVEIAPFNTDFDNNMIEGNYIGTDVTGTSAIGNTAQGIYLVTGNPDSSAKHTVIRGNLISGNLEDGIAIFNGALPAHGSPPPIYDTEIEGNFIGTDATSTAKLPNLGNGVKIFPAFDTLIGGTTTAARNVISGNQLAGVYIYGLQGYGGDNRILGNYIGTDKTGAINLGNSSSGILIGDESSKITVGGNTGKSANHIAYNGGAGIEISGSGSTSNAIQRNSIYNNAKLGIDLNGDYDVTQNDLGDADTGPNNLQNYPLITFAKAASKKVNGTLDSAPNTTYLIRFFGSPACSALGNGEGKRFLGSLSVTTNNTGHARVNTTVKYAFVSGATVTATATDPQGSSSEFSACKTAT